MLVQNVKQDEGHISNFPLFPFLHRFVSREGIRFHSWLSVEESLELEWKLFFLSTDVIVDEKRTRI